MAGAALKAVEAKVGDMKKKCNNYINGKFVEPGKKQYFENISPVTGEVYCQAARSDANDIEAALDAAHAAKITWSKTSVTERATMLLKIADRMEQNLEKIATVEAWDKGKPIREAFAADIPLAIDHFRYFASAIRTQEGGISEIDESTVAYHFHEPLGVVGQIIPWNFPILMAAWKLAPALAAGNTVVMKPAEQTPVSIVHLMEIIGDLIPAGVVNVVHGFGVEAGKPLAESPRIAKIAFTGETSTGSLIMEYAAKNITQVTLELGGKSPQIFMPDIFDHDDELADKAMEAFAMFALNQGECCTCPSRALVHSSIYDKFMEKAIARVKTINVGNPMEFTTKVGAQASEEQMNKILKYFDIGRKEGAQIVIGGERCVLEGEFKGGYYVKPTVFTGDNTMRVFREEIFGPVVSVSKFDSAEEALKMANDSEYGLASAVWTRDYNLAYRMSRGIEAGRVWINSYHLYPAHAAFGGYKKSGFGRECHKQLLEHYQNTKNVIASYGKNALGFF